MRWRHVLLGAAMAMAACGDGDADVEQVSGDLPADAFDVVAPSVAGDDVDLAAYAGP